MVEAGRTLAMGQDEATGAGRPTVDAPFGEALVGIARRQANIVGLSADLAKYTDILPFRDAFPERFFNIGMAEQNLIAVAAGWLYTGGPRPYGYAGLGEVFVFVFFGLLATAGTTYVHELEVPPAAWAAGCATGLLACAILAINNLRDVETDAEAGKRTLAVRLGRPATRALIGAFLAGALLVPVVVVAFRWASPWALLPLLTAPAAFAVVRATASAEAPVLIRALRRSAVVEVWWALLWTLGLLL